jgi:Ca2+-binding EF-hand superfamily protein
MRASALPLLLAAAVAAGAGPAVARAAGDDWFARVDTDADGRVSLAEFVAKMSWAFSQRDRDGDGVLQPSEQHVADAKPITLAAHHARLARQFARQDTNGDGFLSRRELLAPPR